MRACRELGVVIGCAAILTTTASARADELPVETAPFGLAAHVGQHGGNTWLGIRVPFQLGRLVAVYPTLSLVYDNAHAIPASGSTSALVYGVGVRVGTRFLRDAYRVYGWLEAGAMNALAGPTIDTAVFFHFAVGGGVELAVSPHTAAFVELGGGRHLDPLGTAFGSLTATTALGARYAF